MSIRARIEDAVVLWHTGRREGALLSALVAAAATSRKRYPKGRHAYDRRRSLVRRAINGLFGRGSKTNAAPPHKPNVSDIHGNMEMGKYWPSSDKENRLKKPRGDRVAFTQFVHDEMRLIGGPENFNLKFRGEMWPLQELLYTFIRCELAHEAGIPRDIVFEPGDQFSICVTDEQLTLPEILVDRIASAVRLAPENASDFENWDEWIVDTFSSRSEEL
ncbi:MAG: hypothetical protein J5J06_15830 [Phycisphaerae bacterium]|nr:hypothetical protein [Phycisphaerae bacterium]